MASKPEIINSHIGLGWQSTHPWLENNHAAKLIDQSEISLADIAGMDIEAAFQYWDQLRGKDIAPTRQAFKIDNLPPKLVPSMAIIDFVGGPIDFYYRFFGSNMVQVSGMELTGKYYYADKVEGYGFINAKLLPRLIETRSPICHVSRWKAVNELIYETTTVRLPLADEKMSIVGGVTANSWARV